MKTIAVYPGTFDPVTNGHIDIIKRAKTIFDEVIVAIAESTDKRPMFSMQCRKEMLEIATQDMPCVRIETFDTLLVDFAKEMKTKNIIRGLRAISDFEYELQLSYANSSLDPNIETIFLMPTLENAFISSSVVRAILKHNGPITRLVPKEILPLIDKDSYVCSI
ncbi:MAG TPA: pantetheine-phosphate adenylyltransferase [Campylobacterales bacterium]|nr:pantetheine-phosphate adenylyltransferase [Campylobacterales bacterium]